MGFYFRCVILYFPYAACMRMCVGMENTLQESGEYKRAEDLGERTISTVRESGRIFPDAEEATGFFLPPEIRVLAIRILIGALCCFTITAVKSFRKEQKSEPSIPVLPADAEDFKYDTFESHRADPDPDTPYVDIPEHGSTKTWMNNLTILPQVLYEDDRFKVEITGCKAKRDALEISTRVINDSTFRISAHAVRDSVYINQLKSSENLSFGYRTEPGESEERIISLRGRDIPWYDAYLDEIRLCLEICNEDEEDYRSPGYTLVTTEPIIIRTETVDPEIPKPSLIQPDQGMKVLYEEDGVRIVRTGLFEAVFLKDGKAGMLSSTFWQIVVENDTPDEIVIDNVDCETNGRGNLGEIHSTTVPSGFREERWYFLCCRTIWRHALAAGRNQGIIHVVRSALYRLFGVRTPYHAE